MMQRIKKKTRHVVYNHPKVLMKASNGLFVSADKGNEIVAEAKKSKIMRSIKSGHTRAQSVQYQHIGGV